MSKPVSHIINYNIEIVRIVAIFIVIALHISLPYIENDLVVYDRLLIKSFLLDAVPCFWLIMGFFLFNGRSFRYKLKNALVKIALPSFLVMLLSQIFASWIYSQSSIIYCLKNINIDVINLFSNIIKWNAGMILCPHLWYVFEYLKIILWYPLLKYLCVNNENQKKVRKYLIFLSIISIVIKDIQQFYVLEIGNIVPFDIIGSNILMVIVGYEISINTNKLKKNHLLPMFSFIIFIIANYLRFILQSELIKNDLSSDYFLHTGKFIGIISSICLFISIYSLNLSKLSFNLMKYISSKVFYIYLIHWMVFLKMDTVGVKGMILEITSDDILGDIFYTFFYALICFITSFCVVFAGEMIIKCIKWLIIKFSLIRTRFY